MKDYLASFVQTVPNKTEVLKKPFQPSPQNPQKVEESFGKALPEEPSKPSKVPFEGFEVPTPVVFSKSQCPAVQAEPSGEQIHALGICPHCGDTLRLQDRKLDAWYCPACRKWCNGAGQPLAEIETVRPLTLEEVEARQLIADLLAAGCGFVSDDGEHVRITHANKISSALWMRIEEVSPEFTRLALETAREHEGEGKPKWVM